MTWTEIERSNRGKTVTFSQDYKYAVCVGVAGGGSDSRAMFSGSGTVLYSQRYGNGGTNGDNVTLTIIEDVKAGDTIYLFNWKLLVVAN